MDASDTLTPAQAKLFFRLMNRVLFFVQEKKKPLKDTVMRTPEEFHDIGFDKVRLVQKALFQDLSLIDGYLEHDPFQLTNHELSINGRQDTRCEAI